jgi:hypothetical protein
MDFLEQISLIEGLALSSHSCLIASEIEFTLFFNYSAFFSLSGL